MLLVEAQKYSLPSLEPLQIQEVMTQLDSCDQLQMDPLDNGKNVVVEGTGKGTQKNWSSNPSFFGGYP